MKEKNIYENDDVVIVMRKKEKDKEQGYTYGQTYDSHYGFVHSMYARFFDSYNEENFTGNKECDELFIELQERYANDMLRRDGYIFLNQVYELLGLPKTQAGQTVGWLYSEKSEGDRFVKLTRNPIYKDDKYVGFIIDFNVDGEILTKLKGESK